MIPKKILTIAIILAALASSNGIIVPGAATQGYGAAALQLLPIDIHTWIPIALLIVLLITIIAAFIYMLSGIIGSQNVRAWSLGQVNEAFVSLIFLLIFAFFTYLFFINPQGPFGALGLIPPGCTGSSVNTIYTLSACDINAFTTDAFTMTQVVFFTGYFAGISSGINAGFSAPGIPGISASVLLSSFVPSSAESILGTMFSALLFMLVLNQVQVLFISAALLFLSLFMVIGLIARTFGITRSFGGIMIAFGLGLGLVYPLLVTISYGFILNGIGTLNFSGLLVELTGLVAELFFTILTSVTSGSAYLLPNNFILPLAYVIAGLTFIPFINFTILETFVSDFSKALGQQVSFLSLISTLL